MKIEFAWHDRKGHSPNFRVWRPYPTIRKFWMGKLVYLSLWKWAIVFDFRNGGFLGYIKETIWKDRLKNRQN